jgi:hypothetical protein
VLFVGTHEPGFRSCWQVRVTEFQSWAALCWTSRQAQSWLWWVLVNIEMGTCGSIGFVLGFGKSPWKTWVRSAFLASRRTPSSAAALLRFVRIRVRKYTQVFTVDSLWLTKLLSD